MRSVFTAGESFVLLAGICWLVSLPLLAAGFNLLWLAAQGLYFMGVALMIWRYFTHYVRD